MKPLQHLIAVVEAMAHGTIDRVKMNCSTLCRLAMVICTPVALLLPVAAGSAPALAQAQFTAGRTLNFVAGSEKERVQWRKIPAAREIVEGEFAYAKEDLNFDGRPELILLARSATLCGDGGCALLVMRRTTHGIEPLRAAKVDGKLALTKELVDGYRALAVLDGQGKIAVGNQSGSPLFGKQVVYPMRPGTQMITEKAAAESLPVKAKAVKSAKNDTLELADFIKMFMEPKGTPATLGDWTFGARQGSPINWKTSGIRETSSAVQAAGYYYQRVGEVVFTIDGKPTHQVLERKVVPGRWTITLLGPRGGFTKVNISTPNSQELGSTILEGLKGKLPLQLYRCKTPSISSGNKVYQVQGTGKKPFWINEEWSCGSAGCSLSLDLVFTKNEADRFECF